MKRPKFSIVTSVHLWHQMKAAQLQRCMESVETQTFSDLEWVLVDDGSPMPVPNMGAPAKLVRVSHGERIKALEAGLKEASGEWIAFIDSDDELLSHHLECINQMIELNPKEKMFNFGSIHVNRNYQTRIRDAFKPAKKKEGHEVFGGGNIVNGTFVFKRAVYEDLGGYPSFSNPWDFSIHAQEEFPELRQFFMVDHVDEPEKIAKELGNPWGNDFYLFYKYTRKYHSKPYDIPLIMIHHEGKKDGERHRIEDKTN